MNRRGPLIAAGVAGAFALLMVYLFFFVLKGGGEPLAAGPTGPVATGVPSTSPSPTPRETLPPVVLAGARDPFSIPPGLVSASPSGSVGPSGATGVSGATGPISTTPPPTSTTTTPTSPPPTSGSPPPTSPPPPPADTIQIGGHTVTLTDVAPKKAKVEVKADGKLWTVEEGATFDDNFKLVKVENNSCAKFLFGDQSFELCLKGGSAPSFGSLS